MELPQWEHVETPPIFEAAMNNDVETLRELLDADPDLLESTCRNNDTFAALTGRPLHYACQFASLEAIRLLLQRGADVNGLDSVMKSTPLMHACYGGNLGVVSVLLLLGADPSVTAVNGTTCLIKAAQAPTQYDGDHVAVIRLLLEDGRVPVDAQNEYGESALWTACESDETDIARVLLLEGGADHTIPGGHAMYGYETTPLEIAEENDNGGGGCVQLLQVSLAGSSDMCMCG